MGIYVSLLRGINVGGQKKLPMGTLRQIYQDLGFSRIKTYLQSGNVVFESPQTDQGLLTKQIEDAIQQSCGYALQVYIRTKDEILGIAANNPFLSDKNADTSKLHVSFLYRLPTETTWSKVVLPENIPDQCARGETVIYLYYPNGYSKTKIPASYFEKLLAVPLTDRNWNTVSALARMVDES
jgi:uncharacterized protein (DUF1697 family)